MMIVRARQSRWQFAGVSFARWLGFSLAVFIDCFLFFPALAGGSYLPLQQFGGGVVEGPAGVAVNDATGNVYVAEIGRNGVGEFDAAHNAVGSLDTSGVTGSFEGPLGVAVDNSCFLLHESGGACVDPSNGFVYVSGFGVVAESGALAVDVFNAAGGFERQIAGTPTLSFARVMSLTVDAQGDLWVGAEVEEGASSIVAEFSDTGAFIGQFTPNEFFNSGVGVDAAGNVFWLTGGGVEKYVGGFPAGYAGALFVGVSPSPSALAVDSSSGGGDLFVDDRNVIKVYDPAGALVPGEEALGSGPGEIPSGTFSRGIAVDSATGTIYVSLESSVGFFEVFNGPLVGVEPVSGVQEAGARATLRGTVDPRGSSVVECVFEYGIGGFSQSVPCAQQAGSGSAPVAVSASVEGLAANAVYEYRLRARSEAGAGRTKTPGETQAFRSAPALPVAGSVFASGVSPFSATLNGSIDPRNAPVGYHFVYVEAAGYQPEASDPYQAGALVPLPDLYTPAKEQPDTVVPQTLSGLRPGTVYHFALLASGPGGVLRTPDQTFETPGIPLPAVSTGLPGGVSESAATLTGSIDPHGWETTYTFEYGASPGYGQDWPTVQIPLGSMEGGQGVSVYVERLQPGTTYHYRLTASNATGIAYGPDETFTTSNYPTSVVQEAPLLKTTLGVDPRSLQHPGKPGHKPGKHKPRHKSSKKKKKKGKAKHAARGKR